MLPCLCVALLPCLRHASPCHPVHLLRPFVIHHLFVVVQVGEEVDGCESVGVGADVGVGHRWIRLDSVIKITKVCSILFSNQFNFNFKISESRSLL